MGPISPAGLRLGRTQTLVTRRFRGSYGDSITQSRPGLPVERWPDGGPEGQARPAARALPASALSAPRPAHAPSARPGPGLHEDGDGAEHRFGPARRKPSSEGSGTRKARREDPSQHPSQRRLGRLGGESKSECPLTRIRA